MGTSKISLRLKNHLSELETLSRSLEDFGNSLHLPMKTMLEMNLVLEEILTNTIFYGFKDDQEHWIAVEMIYKEGLLSVCIEDDGVPFDPMQAARPNIDSPLEDRKVGGLGVHLVKKLMDEVAYKRQGEKNILVLKKHIPDSEPSS